MAEEFKNEYIQQIYEDLTAHTRDADLDADIEQAVEDLGTAVATAKTGREKAQLFDETAILLAQCAGKFAAGLQATPDGLKTSRVDNFSKALMKVAEIDPKSVVCLFKGATKIEAAYPKNNSGLMKKMAEKIIIKYPQQSAALLDVMDEYVEDYKKQPQKSAEGYQAIYDVYTTAYRKPFSGQIKDRAIASANKIFYEIDFMKNAGKLDKDIKRISDNPDNEQFRDLLESHLERAMKADANAAFDDIMANVKAVAQIENEDNRGEIYGITLDAMIQGIPAKNETEIKEKSAKVMSFIHKTMNAEKNPDLKEQFAITAMYALHDGVVDEKGGLIIADDKKEQALGALDKLADAAGYRPEIKGLLASTAEKYKDNDDILIRVKGAMMRAFDSESASKKTINEETQYEPTMFEKRMRNIYVKIRNTERLNKEIATLLNLEYGGHKYDATRPLKPSKKEMAKAVNKLSEYSQITDYLPDLIIGKMDTEQFTNVDDKILDKFASLVGRVRSDDKNKEAEKKEYREKIVSQLQKVRTDMHNYNLRKSNKITFSKEDAEMVRSDKVLKGAELEKLAEKKTIADHAPKKFSITFDKDAKSGEER